MENTLYTSGDYIILKHESPYTNIQQFFDFEEKAFDGGAGTILKRSFRYSFDNSTFSEFIDLTAVNLSKIQPADQIWFNFKYLLLSGGPFSIREIYLKYANTEEFISGASEYNGQSSASEAPSSSPVSYNPGFLWNPYEMGQAIRLYKDLNLMVNNLFGHEVWYYKHTPNQRSKDIFLMEYTLYENEPKQCVKVVVPRNQFPDNKVVVGPYGATFENQFEIQMDKDYFQAVFGAGAGPQIKDVLYFPRTQRIYEVNASYLYRNFMNEPLYYKVILVKWNPKHDTDMSTDLKNLEHFAKSADKLLGASQEEIENKLTNLEQFVPSTTVYDPTRARIPGNYITKEELIKNYNLTVSENFYALQSSISDSFDIVLKGAFNDFQVGQKYFIRTYSGGNISYPDIQYSYSLKILTCIDILEEGVRFTVEGGVSQVERIYTLTQLFSSDEFSIYDEEFTEENNNDGLIINCSLLKLERYKEKVISYKANTSMESIEDRNFSAWFRLKQNTSPSTMITLTKSGSLYSVVCTKQHNLLEGDTVSIRRNATSNFLLVGKVESVVDDKTVTVNLDREVLNDTFIKLPKWEGYSDLKMFKSEERVFIDSTFDGNNGIKIFSYENQIFKVRLNEKEYLFSTSIQELGLETDKWFAISVNISNTFKQLSLNIWERQWDPQTNTPATNQMRVRVKGIYEIDKIVIHETPFYYITPSYTDITNIRIYKNIIETDKQSLVLNQQIVKDVNNAIIVDNSLPILNLPKLGYTR